MNRLKKLFRENKYAKWTCFILVNAIFLYILFFVIKDFPKTIDVIGNAIGSILDAAKTLIIGLVMAYVLSPLVIFVDNKLMTKIFKDTDDAAKAEKRFRKREVLSIIVSLLIVFLALAFLIYSFAALLLGQISIKGIEDTIYSLLYEAEDYQDGFKNAFSSVVPDVFSDKIGEILQDASDWVSDNISVSGITSGIAGICGSIVNIVIGLIFAIYLLLDKKFFIGLWNQFISLVSPTNYLKINGTLHEVHDVLTSFIKGACVDSLIVAVLSSVALTILGLEGAIVIGIFGGMANLIPYFGPILGMVPAFFMGLVTDGFWTGALAVVILFAIQQIDANIIYPKVVGSQTGLRPLYVLFAITFLGHFGGIVGMLLAVPTAGVVQVFVLKIVNRRKTALEIKAKRKIAEATEELSTDSDALNSVSGDDGDKSNAHE